MEVQFFSIFYATVQLLFMESEIDTAGVTDKGRHLQPPMQ